MDMTIGFQLDPFTVDLPQRLTFHKKEVRAHSKQELTTAKGLAGRLWVIHWPGTHGTEEVDYLWFIPKASNKIKNLGILPKDLDTTKKFTATLIVTKDQTVFEFKQGDKLTYDGVLKLAEGEKEEPADDYSIGQILAVAAIALVVLLGVAYATTPK